MTQNRNLPTVHRVKAALGDPDTKERINQALLGVMPGDGFAELCIIAASDEKLAACHPGSLVQAFVRCAQAGLPPGRDLGLVALIPRGGKVDVQVQWQGFKVLMERVPGVRSVRPVLVHTTDHFAFTKGVVDHRIDPFDDAREFLHPDHPDARARATDTDDGSGLRGGYMAIEYDDGRMEYHFVTRSKIHKNRAAAQTQKVWMAWFPEMCVKTIVRDAWNRRVLTFDPAKVGAAAVAHLGAAESIARADEDPSRVTVRKSRPRVPHDVSPARVAQATVAPGDQWREQYPEMARKLEGDTATEQPRPAPAPERKRAEPAILMATAEQCAALEGVDRGWIGRVVGAATPLMPRQLTLEQADQVIVMWEEYLQAKKDEDPATAPASA